MLSNVACGQMVVCLIAYKNSKQCDTLTKSRGAAYHQGRLTTAWSPRSEQFTTVTANFKLQQWQCAF